MPKIIKININMFRSMFVNPKYNNNQIKFLYDKIIHEAKKGSIPEFTILIMMRS